MIIKAQLRSQLDIFRYLRMTHFVLGKADVRMHSGELIRFFFR